MVQQQYRRLFLTFETKPGLPFKYHNPVFRPAKKSLSLTPPWLFESCDLIGWPQPLLRAPFTSPLKPASADEGRKAKPLCSRRNPPRHKRTFQTTQTDPLAPHSDADFLPSSQFISVRCCNYSESVDLPWAELHTNIISAVTQAAFTGRRPGWGWKAAIAPPVYRCEP